MRKERRTVKEVILIKEGKSYDADLLLSQTETWVPKYRAIQNRYIAGDNDSHVNCLICLQPVKILGNGGFPREGNRHKIFYFQHIKEAVNCPYYAGKNLSPDIIRALKYDGAKESYIHKYIKNQIIEVLGLCQNSRNIKVEKRITSDIDSRRYRKPDIFFEYKNCEIALEIQISTEYPLVIIERSIFYRNKKSFLIWIVDEFKPEVLTQTDIMELHRNNIFIFNRTCYEKSLETKKLHLEVKYLMPSSDFNNPRMGGKLISIDDLVFNSDYSVHYFDFKKAVNEIKFKELKGQLIEEYLNKIEKYVVNIPKSKANLYNYTLNKAVEITPLMVFVNIIDYPIHYKMVRFLNTYTITQHDIDFLKYAWNQCEKYSDEPQNKESLKSIIIQIGYYSKYQKTNELNKSIIQGFFNILNILNSIKYNEIIGFNLNSMLAVLEYSFKNYSECYELFKKAISYYRLIEKNPQIARRIIVMLEKYEATSRSLQKVDVSILKIYFSELFLNTDTIE